MIEHLKLESLVKKDNAWLESVKTEYSIKTLSRNWFVENVWCILQIVAVCAFAQTLRRYTSLNHLAQAARAVLQNSQQISQMLADLNRVDFNNVQVSNPNLFWGKPPKLQINLLEIKQNK